MVFNKSLLVCRLQPSPYGGRKVYRIIITFKNKPNGGIVISKLGYLCLEINKKVFFIDLQLLAS